MRIAVLDDDPVQLEHVVHTLNKHLRLPGTSVTCVTFDRGESLRRALRRETFDLLLLDWNIPDLDGADLLRWLRDHARNSTRVIMLSARTSEGGVAAALGWGADDYVTKPYRPLELCARIRRLVQHTPQAYVEQECFGNWRFDRAGMLLCHDAAGGQAAPLCVPLTDRELRLALTLFRNAGKVVSRGHLLDSAGYDGDSMSRLLDSHIYRLRTKLSRHSEGLLHLQTVYGQGYRLAIHDTGAPAPAPQAPPGGERGTP